MTRNSMARLCLLVAIGIAPPALLRAQQDAPPPAKPAEAQETPRPSKPPEAQVTPPPTKPEEAQTPPLSKPPEAQVNQPPAKPEEAEETRLPWKPPEGSFIINLPSADTPALSTLQILFTHRFSTPLEDANIHNLFTFDSTADVNIGLSYVPVKNLEVGFYRARALEDYEVFAKYSFLSGASPFHAALRLGEDFRTEKGYPDRYSFFVQAIGAVTLFERIRLSVMPTFITQVAGQRFVLPPRDDVFNVPAAVSISETRTINLQGEIVPRCCQSPGTAWIVSIEKTLPRHRFSLTFGNLRAVTVDQYLSNDFNGLSPSNVYIGFNIVRQWKL